MGTSGPTFAHAVEFSGAVSPQPPFTIAARISTTFSGEVISWGTGDRIGKGVEFRLTPDGNLEYGEHDGSRWSAVAASPSLNLLDGSDHDVAVVRFPDGHVLLYADGHITGEGSTNSNIPADLKAGAKSARLHASSNDL